jgi:hypothetical protein
MSEHKKPKVAAGVVTSDGPAPGSVHDEIRWPKPPHRKWVIVGLIVLVVLGVCLVVANKMAEDRAHQAALEKAAAQLSSDYTSLSEPQLATKVEANSGYTLEEIKSKDFSDGDFSTFDQAYSAAQGLYMVNRFSESAKVYGFAAAKASTSTPLIFYTNYAQSAQAAGDTALWKQVLTKAKQVVEASNSSQRSKDDQIKMINDDIKAKEAGF